MERRTTFIALFLLLGAGSVFGRPLPQGLVLSEDTKIQASDGMAGDFFGSFMDADDTAFVVGAPDSHVLGMGAAYVYEKEGSTWRETRLVPSVLPGSELFGGEIAIDAGTAAVGAPCSGLAAGDAGAVYVFVRSGTTWVEQTILTASDAQPEDAFGAGVDLKGDWLAVGAPGDDDVDPTQQNAESGAVYVSIAPTVRGPSRRSSSLRTRQRSTSSGRTSSCLAAASS